jgi:quercetin dioxygenase-like cupin family protein
MKAMDEQAFRQKLEAAGCDEIAAVEWEANTINESHTHDFSASLMVLSGEMTVTSDSGTTTCRAGDTFELAADMLHAETVGDEGIRFLVGRM